MPAAEIDFCGRTKRHVMIFSTCPTCEIDRLTRHKQVLLELIREGLSVGYSVEGFVRWQKRAEFIVRNEPVAP